MKPITSPIDQNGGREAVANLQEGLQALLENSAVVVPHNERGATFKRLRAERAEATFGDQTRKLVIAFQQQMEMPATGNIDLETAALLSAQLVRIGALHRQPMQPPAPRRASAIALETLGPVLQSFPHLADEGALQRLGNAVERNPRAGPRAWPGIAEEAGISPEQVEELRLALEWAALTDRDPRLVAELQRLRASGRIRTGRDLAAAGPDILKDAVRRAGAVGGGELDEAAVAARSSELEARLTKAYPAVYLARMMAAPPAIDLALVGRILAANPKFDPARPAPRTLNLDEIGVEERPAAAAALEALRREINTFPDFDYRAALQAQRSTGDRTPLNPIRAGVQQFLERVTGFDLAATPVAKYAADHPEVLDGLADPPRVIAQVQRMQRIWRVAPRIETTTALMAEGMHSAFRIIRMPAEVFVDRFSAALGGDVAASVYAAAGSVTAAITSIAWAARMRSAGPLPVAVGAWPPPPLKTPDPELARLLGPDGGRKP